MNADNEKRLLLGTLAVAGLASFGLMAADIYPRFQHQMTHCEQSMFGFACHDRPVSELRQGEINYNGGRYSLIYRPSNRETYVQIEPRRFLGINIGGSQEDIDQAVTDLEARGCSFNTRPFDGKKVRNIVFVPDFPDPPVLKGAITFIENGDCIPRPPVSLS